MDFFEKLGKTATETFNSAGEKVNRFAEDTKLKLKINDCKSKIKDLYEEIGKKVYEKYVLDGNLDIQELIREELEKIGGYTSQIEEFEKSRLELADMKQCENCKNKIDRSAKFCPECGAEQPEEPVHEAEVVDGENCNEEVNSENMENVEEENTEDNNNNNENNQNY